MSADWTRIADAEPLLEASLAEGWGDGLPLVPTTTDSVERMAAHRNLEEVIGEVPPRRGKLTVAMAARLAVAAGCKPEYFPVVIAACQAALDPAFRLHGIQTTTSPCAVLIIVSGPVAEAASIHGGSGCLGPGWRANATIGRTVRLVLQAVGGARPGVVDRATHGQSGKFTYCFAENADQTPWQTFTARRKLAGSGSAVTVYAGEAPLNIQQHDATTAGEILDALGQVTIGIAPLIHTHESDTLFVLSPEHAALMGEAGLDGQSVEKELFRRIQVNGQPAFGSPENVLVVVAGGAGKHSLWIPSFGHSKAVTRALDGDGTG